MSEQTIVVQVTPAPPDPETIADLGTLSALFFGAAVVILCARALIKLFSSDSHND